MARNSTIRYPIGDVHHSCHVCLQVALPGQHEQMDGQGETADMAETAEMAEMAEMTALLAIIVLSMLRMIAHGSFTLS